MLTNQKHLFSLSEECTYLNCATLSPQLKSVEQVGIEHLTRKSQPQHIESGHFFRDRIVLKERFANLVDAEDPHSIAIIPSVSYGIATVIKNISFEKADEIVLLEEQFPSNFYAWKALEKSHGVKLRIIAAPPIGNGRGKLWNEQLHNAINPKTRVVAIPHVHWADGTLFDLKAIRARTEAVGVYMIIDGTQSVGALPFSVKDFRPDALICAGYKWLMGAYGLGIAYFSERFYNGSPLENNWINHEGSEDFTTLVHYNESFKPKASRFDMGESSNFIHVPMLSEGIRQILEWQPKAIQEYCESITAPYLDKLISKGYFIEEGSFRGRHMFGVYLQDDTRRDQIKQRLQAANIHVSYRGKAIRVSPHVYNLEKDIQQFVDCLD